MLESRIPDVGELIVQRYQTNIRDGDYRDGFKLGVVIEGGSMRGIVGAGSGVYFQSIGLFRFVDAIYGVSGGVCTAYYSFADQAPLGTSIYYQDLVTDFISPVRIFSGKPIVDIPFLTHDVMWGRKTLAVQRILDLDVPIHVYTTDAYSGKAVDLYPVSNREQIHDAMLYSCLMPFWAGMPRKYQGRFLADGAVATSGVAFKEAVEDGCTHLLMVLTRPEGKMKVKTPLDILVAEILRSKRYPDLAKSYLESFKKYNQILGSIKELSGGENDGLKVGVIRPGARERKVSSFETNPRRLFAGALSGYEAARSFFEPYNLPVDENVRLIPVS